MKEDPLIIPKGLLHEAVCYLNVLEIFFVSENFICLFNVWKYYLGDACFMLTG